MDYALKKQLVSTPLEILDTVSQQSVDMDFTLPDYCADMEKILKCTLTPKIYTRTLSGGQLRIDGASLINIIYCDSNKKAIRCCEQTLPFSATFPVSGDVGEYMIFTNTRPEYLNCRALTPRRLTIHGAFSLYVKVTEKQICDIYCGKTEDDLQTRTQHTDISELCEFSQEIANISEAISVRTKTNLETIVRSELVSMLTDVSVSGEKVTVRGEMTLRLFYICDAATGETDRFIYVFPFTQILTGADSDCEVRDIRLDVLSYELLLHSEMISEEPVVNLEAKLCISLLGYKSQNISYISDAYSTQCPTDVSFCTQPVSKKICKHTASVVSKPVLSLGEKPVSRILDIFTETPVVNVSVKGPDLTFTGKVNVCILACTDEGETVSIERQADIFSEEILQGDYQQATGAHCTVTSVSYRLNDNNEIELRIDMRLCCAVSNNTSLKQVTSVATGEGDAIAPKNPLTLYFAHIGESLWDIAKRYNACVETLCEENSISDEILSENRMLLILRA